MGLLSALNKMSGYSAENMNKVFDEFLPVMDSKAICPIGISLKAKGLLSQMLSLPEDWDFSPQSRLLLDLQRLQIPVFLSSIR